MSEVIDLPHEQVVVVPLQKCSGMNFNGIRHQQVTYQYQPHVIMEHNLASCRVLARAGINVESAILRDYHWPSKYPSPFHHQRITADFMLRNPRSFIFNDIGTSKTLTALWAADYLMTQGVINKVLVCSTLSTLQRVWEHEIFCNIMHRSSTILHGTSKRRHARLAEDKDFYIINHHGLKTMADAINERDDIDMVIVDEGVVFRNQGTELWNAMYSVARIETGRGVWWMTGKPMPKAPTDVWAQARIVNPDTVPRYYSRFRDQTMFKLDQFKWVPKRGWEDIVYASVKPAIRYKRSECTDLPPVMQIDHQVEMSKPQAAAYKSMEDNLVLEMDDGLVTAANEAGKLSKLLQLACGAVYDSKGDYHVVDVKPRTDELDAIIEEVGTKLIIFMPFKHLIKVVCGHLEKKHPKMSFSVINGDVGAPKRNKIFTAFQDEDLDIIVAHPAAMAHGLTLTASNTILWWGPVDDLDIYDQANGRISRPSQTRHQYIKHLFCSGVEREVYRRLKTKESMQGILLDMFAH